MNRRRGALRGLAVAWLVLGLVAATAAIAATPAPATTRVPTTASAAGPATIGEPIDPAASSARFRVHLRVAGEVDGRFGAMSGGLEDVGDGLWRVRVTVDTTGLVFDGPAWMLRQTRSSSFLDVERHPRIDFVSEPFPRALLRDGGELAGTLSLRGRNGPVRFRIGTAACAEPGHRCPILVQGRVDRRQWGMTSQRLWLRENVDFDFRVRLQSPPP